MKKYLIILLSLSFFIFVGCEKAEMDSIQIEADQMTSKLVSDNNSNNPNRSKGGVITNTYYGNSCYFGELGLRAPIVSNNTVSFRFGFLNVIPVEGLNQCSVSANILQDLNWEVSESPSNPISIQSGTGDITGVPFEYDVEYLVQIETQEPVVASMYWYDWIEVVLGNESHTGYWGMNNTNFTTEYQTVNHDFIFEISSGSQTLELSSIDPISATMLPNYQHTKGFVAFFP